MTIARCRWFMALLLTTTTLPKSNVIRWIANMKLKFMTKYIQKTKRVPKWCRYRHNFSGAQLSPLVIISRAPSVSCATRLKLSICLFFFLREYLPNRWTYLNKRLHGDGKWLGIEYGGFQFLNFWGGLGWGPKMSLFARICPEWPSQNTIWR